MHVTTLLTPTNCLRCLSVSHCLISYNETPSRQEVEYYSYFCQRRKNYFEEIGIFQKCVLFIEVTYQNQ